MLTVNFPPFEPQLKKINGELLIYDSIRKKYILLTPEEWVRQNFIHWLITDFNYPKSLFRIETGLQYEKMQKRSDILVYDRSGSPFLLVECKSMKIPLTQNVLEQATQYNYAIQAKYIIITNGVEFMAYQMNFETKECIILQSMPVFE